MKIEIYLLQRKYIIKDNFMLLYFKIYNTFNIIYYNK